MEIRTTTKLMIVRTEFDPTVPPTTDLHKTIKKILNLDAEKVILHPTDGKRVLHSLHYFINEIDKDRLNTMFTSGSLKKHLRSRI